MNEQHSKKETRKRRSFYVVRLVLRFVRAIVLFFRDKVYDDGVLVLQHSRLFLGTILITIGALSFTSDKYCDGNASNYYTCTRPATYYYYPWWAMVFILIGIVLVMIWYLRKKK